MRDSPRGELGREKRVDCWSNSSPSRAPSVQTSSMDSDLGPHLTSVPFFLSELSVCKSPNPSGLRLSPSLSHPPIAFVHPGLRPPLPGHAWRCSFSTFHSGLRRAGIHLHPVLSTFFLNSIPILSKPPQISCPVRAACGFFPSSLSLPLLLTVEILGFLHRHNLLDRLHRLSRPDTYDPHLTSKPDHSPTHPHSIVPIILQSF